MNKKLLEYDNEGERTFIVLSGINHPKAVNIKKMKGLKHYEERMLFFLFLLKYPKTKIIYITSKGFNKDLFAYYVGLISKNEVETVKRLKRLTHIEIDCRSKGSLAGKLLKNKNYIDIVKKEIKNSRTAFLRCYNPTDEEREVAKQMGVKLFGLNTIIKHPKIGTKSWCKEIFKKTKIKCPEGFENISNYDQLYSYLTKLLQKNPKNRKIVFKVNYSASGKGNLVLDFTNQITGIDDMSFKKLKHFLENNLKEIVSKQSPKTNIEKYFNKLISQNGIIELFVQGRIINSPSCQIAVTGKNRYKIVSTHEQILDGKNKQKFIGCKFPAKKKDRKDIINITKKIAKMMAKNEIIGNFAIDFIITIKNKKREIYAIEINARKGGTTHPFRIAYYLTDSHYNRENALLYDSKERPIVYYCREFIKNEKLIGVKPMELVELIRYSKINFDKKKNEGSLIYMPGMVTNYGKFGAISIAHSAKKAQKYNEKLLKIVDRYVSKNIID